MNVPPAGRNPVVKQNRKNTISPATTGALFTAGVLGTSTAISWIKEPESMKNIVAKAGGKGKYIAKYAALLASFSAVGALANTALAGLSKIVKPNHPPKAN